MLYTAPAAFSFCSVPRNVIGASPEFDTVMFTMTNSPWAVFSTGACVFCTDGAVWTPVTANVIPASEAWAEGGASVGDSVGDSVSVADVEVGPAAEVGVGGGVDGAPTRIALSLWMNAA